MTGQAWYQELNFVANFVSELDVGEDKTHVALITFSTTAVVSFTYRKSFDREKLAEYIRGGVGVKFQGDQPGEGQTNIGAGLELLVESLNSEVGKKGYRGEAPVVVIVTDGNPTDSNDKLTKYADILAGQGADIYAIGVGSSVNKFTLSEIASGPGFNNVHSKNRPAPCSCAQVPARSKEAGSATHAELNI